MSSSAQEETPSGKQQRLEVGGESSPDATGGSEGGAERDRSPIQSSPLAAPTTSASASHIGEMSRVSAMMAKFNYRMEKALQMAVDLCGSSTQAKKLVATKTQLQEWAKMWGVEAARRRKVVAVPTSSYSAASSPLNGTDVVDDQSASAEPSNAAKLMMQDLSVDGGGDALPPLFSVENIFHVQAAIETISEVCWTPVPMRNVAGAIRGGIFGLPGVEAPKLSRIVHELFPLIIGRSLHVLTTITPLFLVIPEMEDVRRAEAANSSSLSSRKSAPPTLPTDISTFMFAAVDDCSESIRIVFRTLQQVCVSAGPLSEDMFVRACVRICTDSMRTLTKLSSSMLVAARERQRFLEANASSQQIKSAVVTAAMRAVDPYQVVQLLVQPPLDFILNVVGTGMSSSALLTSKTKADAKAVMFQMSEFIIRQALDSSPRSASALFSMQEPLACLNRVAAPPTTSSARQTGASSSSVIRIDGLFPSIAVSVIAHWARSCGDSNESQLLCVKLVSDAISVIAGDDPLTLRLMFSHGSFRKDLARCALQCVLSIHPSVLGAGLSLVGTVIRTATIEAGQEMGFLYCNCLLRLLDSENVQLDNKLSIVNHLVRTIIMPDTSPYFHRIGSMGSLSEDDAHEATPPLLLQLYWLFDLDTRLHHLNLVTHLTTSLSRIVRCSSDDLSAAAVGDSASTITSDSRSQNVAWQALDALVMLLETLSTAMADAAQQNGNPSSSAAAEAVGSATADIAARRTQKIELQRAVDVINNHPLRGITRLFGLRDRTAAKKAPQQQQQKPPPPVQPSDASDGGGSAAPAGDASDASGPASPATPTRTSVVVDPAALAADTATESLVDKIALFLLHTPSLNPAAVGEIVSDEMPIAVEVCRRLFAMLPLRNRGIIAALSELLSVLQLPKEGQKIERLLELFAEAFFNANVSVCNARLFPYRSCDAAFVVIAATVMLNTSLHNPAVTMRTSKEDFVGQLKGTNDNGDFPLPFLEALYDEIRQHPLSNVKGIGAANVDHSAHVTTIVPPQDHGIDLLFFSRDERKGMLFDVERQRILAETKDLLQRHGGLSAGPVPPIDLVARDLFVTLWPPLLAVFSVSMQRTNSALATQEKCVKGLQSCLVVASALGLTMESEVTMMSLLRIGNFKQISSQCVRAVLISASLEQSQSFSPACWSCVVDLLADVVKGKVALTAEAEAVYSRLHTFSNGHSTKQRDVSVAALRAAVNAATAGAATVRDAAMLSARLIVLRRIAAVVFDSAPQSPSQLLLTWKDSLHDSMQTLMKTYGDNDECSEIILESVFSLLKLFYNAVTNKTESGGGSGSELDCENGRRPSYLLIPADDLSDFAAAAAAGITADACVDSWTADTGTFLQSQSCAAKPFCIIPEILQLVDDNVRLKLLVLRALQAVLRGLHTSKSPIAAEPPAIQIHATAADSETLWFHMCVALALGLCDTRSGAEVPAMASLLTRAVVTERFAGVSSSGHQSSSSSPLRSVSARRIDELLLHLTFVGAVNREQSVSQSCISQLTAIASHTLARRGGGNASVPLSLVVPRIVATLAAEKDALRVRALEAVRTVASQLSPPDLMVLVESLCETIIEISRSRNSSVTRRRSSSDGVSFPSEVLLESVHIFGFSSVPKGCRPCSSSAFCSTTLPALLEFMSEDLVRNCGASEITSYVLLAINKCFVPLATNPNQSSTVRSLAVTAIVNSALVMLQRCTTTSSRDTSESLSESSRALCTAFGTVLASVTMQPSKLVPYMDSHAKDSATYVEAFESAVPQIASWKAVGWTPAAAAVDSDGGGVSPAPRPADYVSSPPPSSISDDASLSEGYYLMSLFITALARYPLRELAPMIAANDNLAMGFLDLWLLNANTCVMIDQAAALQNSTAYHGIKAKSNFVHHRIVLQRCLMTFFSLVLSALRLRETSRAPTAKPPPSSSAQHQQPKHPPVTFTNVLQEKLFVHSRSLFMYHLAVTNASPLRDEITPVIELWCSHLAVMSGSDEGEGHDDGMMPSSRPPALIWEVARHPALFGAIVQLLTPHSGPAVVAAVQRYLLAFRDCELPPCNQELDDHRSSCKPPHQSSSPDSNEK